MTMKRKSSCAGTMSYGENGANRGTDQAVWPHLKLNNHIYFMILKS